MKKVLVVFGIKSTGLEIREIIENQSEDFSNYDIYNVEYTPDFVEVNNWTNFIDNKDYLFNYIISFTDYTLRNQCLSHLNKITNFYPINIIHPSANISSSAIIGKGCYFAAFTTISINAKIHDHVIVNLNASVGHDSVIEEHCLLLPGSRVSGNVKLGQGTLVGSNAFIFQGLEIGRENTIDALTPIHTNLPPRMISASRNVKRFKKI